MLELWYEALRAEIGIVVETDDFIRGRAALYAARKASGDLALDGLSLVKSPTMQNQIWIIHNGKGAPDGQG